MRKRIMKALSVMLAVVLTFTAAPLSGFVGLDLPEWLDCSIKSSAATSGKCGDNVYWNFDESTGILTISGTGAMDNYNYNNRPWENHENNIKDVVIENGVTSIGKSAFYWCTSLKNITISDSVALVGDSAFEDCRSLVSVTLPNSIITIGNSAFKECISLTNILLHDGIVSIHSYAFEDCSSLVSITIPKSVRSINFHAFYNCKNLANISIPNDMVYVGVDAFYNTAYYNNANNWEDDVLYIGNNLITAKTTLSGDYEIKSGTLNIISHAFMGCANLKRVTIPDSVKTIGENAFYSCTSITSVTIPKNVRTIESRAFYDCKNLADITISDDMIYIGGDAFYNTAYYNNANNWENDVLYIGNNLIKAKTTFSGDYKIKEGTNTVACYAFRNCHLTGVTIPDSVTKICKSALYNTSLTNIKVDGNNQYYSSDEYGVLFNKDKTILVQYPSGNLRISYVITDSVELIDDTAFVFCDSLINITIPNSVTSIGSGAFSYCTNLTNISIGNSVISIGTQAFYECVKLTEIVIPDTITNIGGCAFDFTLLSDVYYLGTEAKWNEILIYPDNEQLNNATIHYNSTGPDSNNKICIKCGETYNEGVVTKAATCTEDGFMTYTCESCGGTDSEVINATGHTEVDAVVENKLAATCGSDGSCDVVVYCSVCDEELSRETVIVPATGHNYSNGVCTRCGESATTEKSLAVLSTNKSFTVKTGDKMGLSFGVMNNGTLEEKWKKMSIVVSDPTIVSLGNYKEIDYGYAIDITGLKEGSTNLTITDTETGLNTVIVVSVFDEYTETSSYSINEIATFHPNNWWEDHLNTCIYDMNGLYVDNYSVRKSGDKYIVTFDAYNQRYHNGSVDIYDAKGNWIGSECIEKYSNISSLYDTGEQIFYMVFGGSWLTYQHAMQSKKTTIKDIEVPDGGYFTISNNFADSPGCFLYNGCEMLYEGASATIDMLTGNIEGPFIDIVVGNIEDNKATKEMFYELFINAADNSIREYSKDILKGNVDNACSNISGLLEDILLELDIDWKEALKMASGLGESAFEKLAGPAGLALQGCFGISDAVNFTRQLVDLANSISETYATVYSSIDEGFINPYGVTVNTNGNMDAEAVLQVFRVSNDDSVSVILNSDNPLEQHELYNICFVKNDKLVQPNGKVKVYVPIPEGMNSNTCVIYRQETDGSWTILDAKIEGNYLVFETDHFSLYALVGDRAELKIKSLPNKLIYTRNDVIDTTGLVLELNGELITNGYYCTPSVMFEYGTQTITVQYGKAIVEFEVSVLEEPEYNYTFSIQNPSRTEIRNKDGIILHANVEGTAPNGSYVRWEANNGYFDTSADGSNLKIIAKNKGYTTFTAILCDADGNELARDSVEMYSKSGFFDKIGGFFRSLFGTTKIYEN